MDSPPASTETKPGPKPNPPDKPAAPPPQLPPVARRRRGLRWVAAVGALVLVAGVFCYYIYFLAPYEDTDDAFIEANVTIVSPRVSGQVVRLAVKDNQHVHAGDVLIEIDARDYQTARAQADADLATARGQLEQTLSQITVDEAKLQQQQSAVAAAEAESARAAADLKRYESVESRAISRSQLDLARTEATASAANLDVVRNQVKTAEAQVKLSRVNKTAAEARVEQARAKLDQADLNVSYTRVVAPRDGKVTRRTIEEGAYVTTGQSLLALVPDEVWVIANFKETQLEYMRPNQPVTIRIDAYPSRKFRGKVDSIQSGSGARFSLLPPENAVGNYVKVVQRVPVKITFDGPLDSDLDIAPGMSVVPTVRVK